MAAALKRARASGPGDAAGALGSIAAAMAGAGGHSGPGCPGQGQMTLSAIQGRLGLLTETIGIIDSGCSQPAAALGLKLLA